MMEERNVFQQFPVKNVSMPKGTLPPIRSPDETELRDRFALAAMASLLIPAMAGTDATTDEIHRLVAERSYAVAEAMMIERARLGAM